jgi:cytidylate kinase
MSTQIKLDGIRIITVSGRIASGSTTLAKNLSQKFSWKHIEGGEVFWEAIRKKMGLSPKDTNLRPDEEDKIFDEELKRILREEKDIVLETKLAGFNAQDIDGIFKILVLCEKNGEDQTQIRVDRLLNREGVSVEKAKQEVIERERNDVEKWRKLYGNYDPDWTYWNEKYYDLIVNTYDKSSDQTFHTALEALGVKD